MRFRNDDGTLDIASLLGLVMAITGAVLLIDTIRLCSYYPDIVVMAMYGGLPQAVLILIGGFCVLAMKSGGYCLRVAIAGVFVGAECLVDNIFFADFYSFVYFVVGIVAFIVGVMAIVSSLSLICGYSHYAVRLFQCVLVMTAIELYPIWYSYDLYVPWIDILTTYYTVPFMIAIYASMLACLRHESVRIPSVTERIDLNMEAIEDVAYSDQETYMTPEDAVSLKTFVDGGKSGRMDIRLHHGNATRLLSVTSVEGSVPKAVVRPEEGIAVDGFRFDIRMLVYDGGEMLRIYGRTGVFVQISVHPVPPGRDPKSSLPFVSKLSLPRKTTGGR